MGELMVIRVPGSTILCSCCGWPLKQKREGAISPMFRYCDMYCDTEICEHRSVLLRVPFTQMACEIVEPRPDDPETHPGGDAKNSRPDSRVDTAQLIPSRAADHNQRIDTRSSSLEPEPSSTHDPGGVEPHHAADEEASPRLDLYKMEPNR